MLIHTILQDSEFVNSKVGPRSTGHLNDLIELVAKIKAKKRKFEKERNLGVLEIIINKESKIDEEQTESSENRKRAWRGKEVQRRHEPRKNDIRVSKFAVRPPDLGKQSPCFSLPLQASAILSPCPEFWYSIKNIWLLHPPKTFFFEKSQHDKIVYNDTLTICVKRLF